MNDIEINDYNGVDVLDFEELWKNTDNPYGFQSYHDEAFVPYLYKGDYYDPVP